MYLLMLLATFMSAIYGYNLSVRPDYDRDVAHKKALGVIYKFVFQHTAAKDIATRAATGNFLATKALPWILPNDMMYADYSDTDNLDTVLTYRQGNTEANINLRLKNRRNQLNGQGAEDFLSLGRTLFESGEMATKVLCLNGEMQETSTTSCTPGVDEDGNVISSCCGESVGGRYLVSYKRLDARFVNRVTGGVNMDFMKAVSEMGYNDNIGAIQWKNGAWHFEGKINFHPVYAEDEDKWEEEHADDPDNRYYPVDKRKRTVWKLPVHIFGQNFFQSKTGSGSSLANICTQGCLFKIQNF